MLSHSSEVSGAHDCGASRTVCGLLARPLWMVGATTAAGVGDVSP
jgi:hypothetical protein